MVVGCESCGKKNRVPSTATGIPRCGNCHAPLPWIADADDVTFGEVAESPTIPVLVDLWATWCGPCRMVSPALESLTRRYKGRVKLVKVDVDRAPHTAQRFDARGIPTLLVLHHGELVSRQLGAAPEPALAAWLEQALTQIGESTSSSS